MKSTERVFTRDRFTAKSRRECNTKLVVSQAAIDNWRVSMQIHLFRAEGRVFGATLDESGANLPTDLGAWSLFKTIPITSGVPLPGIDVDECIADIERYGFHLTDAHVRITDRYVSSRN
jgi:hypothetical protein